MFSHQPIELRNTISSEKRRSAEDSLAVAAKSISEQNTLLTESAVPAPSDIQSYRSPSRRRTEAIIQEQENFRKVAEGRLANSISEMAFDSLWLDADYREQHRDVLVEGYRATVMTLFENGVLTLDSFMGNTSVAVQEIFALVVEAIEEDLPEEGEAKAKPESNCAIVDAVRKKVKGVLSAEKDIAEKNQEEDEELQEGLRLRRDLRPKTTTLWRTLVLENSKDSLLAENVGDFIQDAVANSLVVYTLLETLSTMNLLGSNRQAMEDLAKSIAR